MSQVRTLSLKCPCGYIKHDVIHLGVFEQQGRKRLLDYCGGLFLINAGGDGVSCKKCNTRVNTIDFHCSFCNRVSSIGVTMVEPVARQQVQGGAEAPGATVLQMSVHQTVVFT